MAERKGAVPSPDQERKGIKLVAVDPRALMKGNIAYSVIDTSRTILSGNFLPEYYEETPSQVLRVQNPRTKEIEYRTKDGHHRIAAGAEYLKTQPDYVFQALDVTGITIRENYKEKKEDFLTELEYYAEIGEPTKAHGDIEFRRMAGHIFTDWRGWVGDEIADKFPALAALQTLGRGTYNIRSLNEAVVHQSIDMSEMTIMGGEDKVTKQKIKEGLKEMASRIVVTGLGYDEIAFAGFELVTSAYEDIGEEARNREINGLLALRDVHNRVIPPKPNPEAYEQNRSLLADNLKNAFQSVRAPREKEADMRREEIRAIINSLATPEMSYWDLIYIVDTTQDGNISFRYNQIKEKMAREKRAKTSRPGPDGRATSGEVTQDAGRLSAVLVEFRDRPGSLSPTARRAVQNVIHQATSLLGVDGGPEHSQAVSPSQAPPQSTIPPQVAAPFSEAAPAQEDEGELAKLRRENAELRARNATLQRAAWWVSDAFTDKEQALLYAASLGTINSFCEANGLSSEEFMERRKNLIRRYRKSLLQKSTVKNK